MPSVGGETFSSYSEDDDFEERNTSTEWPVVLTRYLSLAALPISKVTNSNYRHIYLCIYLLISSLFALHYYR